MDVSHARQIFRRNLVETAIKDAQRLLHHLRLPLHQNQLHRAVDGVLVRSFDRALNHGGIARNRLHAAMKEYKANFLAELQTAKA